MTLFKPLKGKIISGDKIEVLTETGHVISFKVRKEILVDLDNEESKLPFFSVAFDTNYIETKVKKNHINLKQIKKKYKNANILIKEKEYDHIQLGFVYTNAEDPYNNTWMLNFMDVNNKFLFGFNGTSIKLKCPFTTTSWKDGVWHGRFVIYKKDVKELIEPKQGHFVLKGSGNIGNHDVTPIKNNVEVISLRYNIYENTWYCEYLKKDKVIGSTPCKNIICDVPFEGKIDMSATKPKVTVEIKAKNVKGISIALNALIIKCR